jgi:hypothetical protein
MAGIGPSDHVSPDARYRGLSRALLSALEIAPSPASGRADQNSFDCLRTRPNAAAKQIPNSLSGRRNR